MALEIIKSKKSFESFWLTLDEGAKRGSAEDNYKAALIVITSILTDETANLKSRATALTVAKLLPTMAVKLGWLSGARLAKSDLPLERMRQRFMAELPE